MRLLKLILSIILVWGLPSYAFDIVIKSIHQDGKPSYFIPVGKIARLDLVTPLKQDVSDTYHIELQSNKNNANTYDISLGPIDTLSHAKTIQQALSDDKAMLSLNEQTNEKRLWNLQNADIRAVISAVSKATGKNFVIDPRVQGKVSLISSTPIDKNQLYDTFLSTLQVSGYAAVENDGITKIIPNMDAKADTLTTYHVNDKSSRGDELVVQVVPVHYVPADQLVPILRPLMPQWSNIAAYAPSNGVILSGRKNNIRMIASIIREVDSSSANDIDIVPLKYTLAMDIASTLKEIIKGQPGISTRSQPLVSPDDRGNILLVSGSKTDRIRLRLLIQKLDKRAHSNDNANTKVLYLNYLRAEDLVPILAGIAQANFSGNVGTTIGSVTHPPLDSTNPASNLTSNANNMFQSSNSSTTSNPGSAGGDQSNSGNSTTNAVSTQNEGSTKPSVQIIGEPNTNSVILSAPPSIIHILETVTHQLDVKPAQLLIEALVAEVDERDANSLGIEWGTKQQTGNQANFKPGFAIINGNSGKSDLQAEIFALARQNKANILSTPSVVVLDNRQAKILVGQQVSVASTSVPSGPTVATPFITFERVNVALHLYVRPQITRDNGIQLQIDQGNDTIDPSSELNSTTPTFKISSIVTSVHVQSGDIIVLGGLTQNTLGNDDNRLPILGDIPGIGRLFQHNIHSREKKVLMVFIKPSILTTANSFNKTTEKYDHIRQYQLQWLRSQAYDTRNEEAILTPLAEKKLPLPFSQPTSKKP